MYGRWGTPNSWQAATITRADATPRLVSPPVSLASMKLTPAMTKGARNDE
jgi:hypothetical protein